MTDKQRLWLWVGICTVWVAAGVVMMLISPLFYLGFVVGAATAFLISAFIAARVPCTSEPPA